MNNKYIPAFGFGLMVASILYPIPSLAHNTIIQYQATEAIAIEAKFDDGMAMKNAQVVVYAPDNPAEPWQKGLTNAQGQFTFVPDHNISGNWTVKVRSGGHGNVINIPIKALATSEINVPMQNKVSTSNIEQASLKISPNDSTPQLSVAQKLMMATAGSWGFVGTALFFSRKKNKNA